MAEAQAVAAGEGRRLGALCGELVDRLAFGQRQI